MSLRKMLQNLWFWCLLELAHKAQTQWRQQNRSIKTCSIFFYDVSNKFVLLNKKESPYQKWDWIYPLDILTYFFNKNVRNSDKVTTTRKKMERMKKLQRTLNSQKRKMRKIIKKIKKMWARKKRLQIWNLLEVNNTLLFNL